MGKRTRVRGGMPTGARSLDGARRRAPWNAVTNAIGLVANIGFSVFITARLVHGLGVVGYGIWGLVGHVAANMNLLDFGMSVTLTRFLAHHHARDERKSILEVMSTALLFSLIPASLALLAGGLVSWWAPPLFRLPAAYIFSARAAILLTAATVAVSFPGAIFNCALPALSRYDLHNLRNIAWSALRALLLLWVLDHGYGLIAVAAASLLAQIAALVLGGMLSFRLLPWVRLSWRNCRRAVLSSLFQFSVWAFVLSIASRMIFTLDNVVVAMVRGPAAVAFYSVGSSIADQLRGGMFTVAMLFAPLAAQTHAVDGREGLASLLLRGSRLTVLLALPGIVCLAMAGAPMLRFWLGPDYAQRTTPVLMLLCLCVGAYALAVSCTQILYGMNQHRLAAYISLGEALANLSLSLYLGRRLGGIGVAWGTLLPALVAEMVLIPLVTCRLLSLAPLRYYREVLVRPLLAATPLGAWLLWVRGRNAIYGWWSLALWLSPGLLLYMICAWVAALKVEERAMARGWVARRWRGRPSTKETENAPA